MATAWDDRDVTFHAARPDQATEVLSVLDEAAGWLQERGIAQWPPRFQLAWIVDTVARGETWLVSVGDKLGGTLTLDWSDPLWDDLPATAGYVHRMAVRRWAAGLGVVMLRWAADTARQHGCRALRLDCVASNDRLRAYYEAEGFCYRGDVPVGGAPGERVDDGPSTRVSRYELPLETADQ